MLTSGDSLDAGVKLVGATLPLYTFPSRWVEGHEVTVDACVEGLTDVVPHTESFLVDYKVCVREAGGWRERERDRQTDRQTERDRERDRERQRQTERQTHTEREMT